ncbi:MAG: CPBP family intramembrane metalloprotease [Nitrospiraceae bacterium]|nr:CPBP family intramembrane metalloprotease [Nitrospiraceae bacterium]
MKKKAYYAYIVLLLLAFLSHIQGAGFIGHFLPVYLLAAPIVLQRKIRFSFSVKGLLLGLSASLVILAPFYLIMPTAGRAGADITARFIMTQLLAVALPEEVFFRGFLQEALGNTVKAALLSSGLFSLAHLPAFIFQHDVYALLTFFPSLVMGFLYLRSANILPPVIFHFFCNVLFLGFML